MSTGFEIFLKNSKSVKDEHLAKLDKIAQINLEKFIEIYNVLKNAPPLKDNPYIIEIETEITDLNNTMFHIRDFLIKIEKWPYSNVKVDIIGNKIKTCLYLTPLSSSMCTTNLLDRGPLPYQF